MLAICIYYSTVLKAFFNKFQRVFDNLTSYHIDISKNWILANFDYLTSRILPNFLQQAAWQIQSVFRLGNLSSRKMQNFSMILCEQVFYDEKRRTLFIGPVDVCILSNRPQKPLFQSFLYLFL